MAAYFSVVSNLKKDGAIWVLHVHTHDQKMAAEFGDKVVVQNENHVKAHFLRPGSPMGTQFMGRQSKSTRMVAQQGLFCVSKNILCNHSLLFDRLLPKDVSPTFFTKLVIPAALKPAFIRKLRNVNITGGTLFPGIDGLGKAMDEFVRMI